MSDMYAPNYPQNMGYGDQDLMAYLMSAFGGADSTDTGRVLKLMSDPNFAAMAGFYDPMRLQPQFEPEEFVPQYGKIMNAYMNDGDPLIATVAQGLVNGTYTPYAAQQYLMLDGSFRGTSEDAKDLVNSIWKDYQSVQQEEADFKRSEAERASKAKADDPFAKMGLPSPFDRYSAGVDPTTGAFGVNAPLPDGVQSKLSSSTSAYEAAMKDLAAYKVKNPKYMTPDEMAAAKKAAADYGPKYVKGTGASPSGSDTRNSAQQAAGALLGGRSSLSSYLRGGTAGLSATLGPDLFRKALMTVLGGPDGGSSERSTDADVLKRTYLDRLGGKSQTADAALSVNDSRPNNSFNGPRVSYTDKPPTTEAERLWRQKVGTPWEKMKRAERQMGLSQARARGSARALRMLGRTPLDDAMRQRMAFMTMLSDGLGQ